MTRQLTTREAWREIGDAYAAFAATGSRPARGATVFVPLGFYGLCSATDVLRWAEKITLDQAREMRDLIHAALVERGVGFFVVLGPYDAEHAGIRAILAYLYAEMSA